MPNTEVSASKSFARVWRGSSRAPGWLTRKPPAQESLLELGDSVDPSTFSQILEMDESEEERDFSRPLVSGFLDQADETFAKMDTAL